MQRKLFENESCRTLLASLFKFISWGFIYLKRHLAKSTVKRLELWQAKSQVNFRIAMQKMLPNLQSHSLFLHYWSATSPNRQSRWVILSSWDCQNVCSRQAKSAKTDTTGFSLQVHFLELRFHLPEAPPYQIYSQEIGWYCHFDRQNWQVNFSDRLFASMPAEQSFRRGSEICSSKNGDSHYCILSSISFR